MYTDMPPAPQVLARTCAAIASSGVEALDAATHARDQPCAMLPGISHGIAAVEPAKQTHQSGSSNNRGVSTVH